MTPYSRGYQPHTRCKDVRSYFCHLYTRHLEIAFWKWIRDQWHLRNFHSNRVMRKVEEAAASIQALPKFPARHYSTQTGCTRSKFIGPQRLGSRGGRGFRGVEVLPAPHGCHVPSQCLHNDIIELGIYLAQRTHKERPIRELPIASNSDWKLS